MFESSSIFTPKHKIGEILVIDRFKVYVERQRGRWYAYRALSPIFCFEASTKNGVIEHARRAIGFWRSSARRELDAAWRRKKWQERTGRSTRSPAGKA